jgi:hypothetical protein
MEVKYDGRLPEWRYRAISGPAQESKQESDAFQLEAHGRLAAQGLPWCFGEMDYPHWRRVPLSAADGRTVSYYVGDDPQWRQTALKRLILCAKCPVFNRCHGVTVAKKSVNPSLAEAKRKAGLLSALAHM